MKRAWESLRIPKKTHQTDQIDLCSSSEQVGSIVLDVEKKLEELRRREHRIAGGLRKSQFKVSRLESENRELRASLNELGKKKQEVDSLLAQRDSSLRNYISELQSANLQAAEESRHLRQQLEALEFKNQSLERVNQSLRLELCKFVPSSVSVEHIGCEAFAGEDAGDC